MTVATAMPVVNAKARARSTKIFFMIVSLFSDAGDGDSVTAIRARSGCYATQRL
jgi:hypothetical protein